MSLVTYKGTEFDYLNPTPKMVDIEDILRSIVRLNRFVGHSARAYSVGEHTFYCYAMAVKLGYSLREQLLVLVHDFTEAYVSDCPAPLKRLLPDFSKIEARVEDVIYQYIGIEPPTEEEQLKIKRVDLTMLVVEMRDLTVHQWENFINDYTYEEVLDEQILKLYQDTTVNEDRLRYVLQGIYDGLVKSVKEEKYGKL